MEWESETETIYTRHEHIADTLIVRSHEIEEIFCHDESERHEKGKYQQISPRKTKITCRQSEARYMFHSLFEIGSDEES
jgi:hypothetical protein